MRIALMVLGGVERARRRCKWCDVGGTSSIIKACELGGGAAPDAVSAGFLFWLSALVD